MNTREPREQKARPASADPAGPPMLEVSDLRVHFPVAGALFTTKPAHLKAVDGVSLELRKGETLGLVGESGCGKSTLARALMKLVPLSGGRILFEGKDVSQMAEREMPAFRRRMQMVFQDPYASLNPRMTLESALAEPLRVHRLAEGAEIARRVASLLDRVGLPIQSLRKYPHEFSGGQRQRIVIARALAMNPVVLIADEPVSALDVSIQAQILNLLASLKTDLGLSLIFIAHDLSVVKHVSDRIAVMYLGRVVETGPAESLMGKPAHPYTRSLINAIPLADPDRARQIAGSSPRGEIPSPMDPPKGCRFHPRCPFAIPACAQSDPALKTFSPDRQAACIREEILSA